MTGIITPFSKGGALTIKERERKKTQAGVKFLIKMAVYFSALWCGLTLFFCFFCL